MAGPSSMLDRKRAQEMLAQLMATGPGQYAASQFSLDPQPEQGLAAGAADMALGMVPGVGQAMSLRDMERARRGGDTAGMAMAGAGMLPIGKMAAMAAGKIGRKSPTPSIEDMQRRLQTGVGEPPPDPVALAARQQEAAAGTAPMAPTEGGDKYEKLKELARLLMLGQ